MRVNRHTLLSYLAFSPVVLLLLFVGYRDLMHDPTRAVERQLQGQIAIASDADIAARELYYGQMRAKIALAEYKKGVKESTKGCECGPDVDKYTEGHRAQWCTMFASWVAKEAGTPVSSEMTKSWRITNSREFAEYLQKNGTWHSRDEILQKGLKPQIGDYVIYWRADFDDRLGHVDIVINPDVAPGVAGTIGGNLKDKVAYRDFPYLHDYGFMGFGRPSLTAEQKVASISNGTPVAVLRRQ